MDGLECSEIMLSDIDKIKFRFDSDYYSKPNLKIEETIRLLGGKSIRDLEATMDCSAFYPSITGFYNTDENGVPFLRVNEIIDGLVQITASTVFLPQEVLDENKKTIAIAYPGDIVIAKGGNTLAKVGLVNNAYDKYAISRDVIVLHTDKLIDINNYYLWDFLHSKYGQSLLWRSASQTGQPHLTLPSIYDMKVPKLSDTFQKQVKILYTTSVKAKNAENDAYLKAEQILFSELKIDDLASFAHAITVKLLSVSFISSGRLDAEYYQPKYDDYITAFCTSDTVGTLCNVHDKNFVPNADTEYMYIELANVGSSGNINGVEKVLGCDLPSRARRKVKAGQVIIASIEGSLQSCALISDEFNNALCSTGFYILDSDNINPETLLVLFKSEPVQALLTQHCSGTILTAITKDELLNMPLPRIGRSVQKQISSKVQESFALHHQSEQLLENAKRAVEIAIEQGEDQAMAWLREKGVEC